MFLYDSFTDVPGTSITLHAGEYGAEYLRASFSGGGAVITNANRLRSNSTLGDVFYSLLEPGGADYVMETGLRVFTILDGQVGVLARMRLDERTYYQASYNVPGGAWELYKAIAGAFTLLGSFAQALSPGDTPNLKLDCQGDSIRILVDDVERVSVIDSDIPDAGRGAILLYSASTIPTDTTGIHMDWVGATLVSDSPGAHLSLQAVSPTTISVLSTAAAGGEGPFSYQLQRAPDVGGSPGAWGDIGVPQSGLAAGVAPAAFSDATVVSGTRYHYRVEVTDDALAVGETNSISVVARSAATYYLSSAGNDASSGTSTASPWLSVSKVNSWGLMPGDTLLIRGGDTFAGNLLINPLLPPGSSSRITVDSYGTGTGIIDGADSYGIKGLNCGYITIGRVKALGSGLDISGTYPNKIATSTNTSSGVVLETNTLIRWYSGVVIDGVEVEGFRDAGIIFINTQVGATRAHEDFLIDNFYIHDCGVTGIWTRGTSAEPGLFHHVNGGRLYRNSLIETGRIIHIPGITDYDYGNPGAVNLTSGFPLFLNCCEDVVSGEGVLCDDFGDASNNLAGGGPAVFFVEATRGIIRGSESLNGFSPSGADGNPFDVDGGCVDSVVEYCHGFDCTGECILVGQFSPATAHSGTIIRYNIFERCVGGMRTFGIPGRSQVYHCVFYITEGVMFDTQYADFKNCIFVLAGPTATFGDATGCTFQGNVWFVTNGATFAVTIDGVEYNSIEELRADGFEMDGATPVGAEGDPMFEDGGNGTQQLPTYPVSHLSAYDIGEASSARGVGVVIPDAPTADWHGNSASIGPIDAGPVRYGSHFVPDPPIPTDESSLFLGLTSSQRWGQIYLALGGASECFAGATVFEQQRLILSVLGSEECIYTTEDFWRAWAAFLGIGCVGSVMDAQRQIYGYYYDEAGDDSLADPSCFEGLGPDGQLFALFQSLGGQIAC